MDHTKKYTSVESKIHPARIRLVGDFVLQLHQIYHIVLNIIRIRCAQ